MTQSIAQKNLGGKGMEGMEKGWEASTKSVRMGHTLAATVIPGARPQATRPHQLNLPL